MGSSRKPRFLLILMLGLCGFFVFGYAERSAQRAELERGNDALRAEIGEAEAKQKVLLKELAYVRSPDYLEETARKDFDMGLPGDRAVVIVHEGDAAPAAPSAGVLRMDTTVTSVMPVSAPARSTAAGKAPVWQQWVNLFAGDTPITR
jgi:cell division protein FtsB